VDINERIQGRREVLGLSDVEVAKRARLSIDEYCDVEACPTEFTDVLRTDEAKRLAEALGLDLLELMGLKCSRCEGEGADASWFSLSPAGLLRLRREELGLTRGEVSDQAGWKDQGAGLALLEDDASFPEDTTINTVLDLSRVLMVPADLLLGVRCPRCRL
jgi:transcriptional regulator with XRE-family HTH domain